MKRLGIIQGRLSPPINGQIQAFPLEYWQDEFSKCKELGLGSMEWIFEYPQVNLNPVCSDSGIAQMMKLSKEYSVKINSVLADYFMAKKLFGDNLKEVKESIDTLCFLIGQCKKCEIPLIEIPFVDDSALSTEKDKKDLINNLKLPLEEAKRYGIGIALETSLEPKAFKELIIAFKPFDVGVNYDMGNSASLGYDSKEEIKILGEFITNVHIKDRIRNGSTVSLGDGDTDFNSVFTALKSINYSGDYMLQAARCDILSGDNKDINTTVSSYINFIKSFLEG